MHRLPLTCLVMSLSLSSLLSAESNPATVSLQGRWRFAVDRENRGITERWFERQLDDTLDLPGSMPGQGRGDPVTLDTPWMGSLFDKAFFTEARFAEYRKPGDIKIPFWLQPDHYYAGVAWYQRDIEIPSAWANRRVVLSLERPHWETQVWVDGRHLGSNNTLSTAHEYALGTELTAGRHTLSIRVDNGRLIDIGENSHSISDHTQGNWNGIVGRIELQATAPVWIDDLQLYPQLSPKAVRVTGQLGRENSAAFPAQILLTSRRDHRGKTSSAAELPIEVARDGRFSGIVPLPADTPVWDEFTPELSEVEARLENGEHRTVRFGLREVTHAGRQLQINGHPLFIRATLECAIFPKTGHPPTEIEPWRDILRIARAHGLNSLRFHSWCPPEAAFIAGDELGFYFQIEAASWPNQSTTLGEGKPVDDWIEQETRRILRAYGNHPSFMLMTSGNEPGGAEPARDAYLAQWVKRHQAVDSRHLFSGGSGWPILAENQYLVHSDPRIQHWSEGLKSRINALPPETVTDYSAFIAGSAVPVISHEIGQWCVFPDFAEIPQYTGYLHPKNFEIFRDMLNRNGLGAQAADFVQASGKLQALCYKEDIEAALRTPQMAGFQLLDLHDFPGQGTALVGVLNPFWQSKGYITAEQFHRFCASTVPLARLPKRVFTTADTLTAHCEVAHYGAAPLSNAKASWRLVGANGESAARGDFPDTTLALGNTAIGEITLLLTKVPAPAQYRLVISVDGHEIENDWDIWVYPADAAHQVPQPARTLTTESLNAEALAALTAGQTVLLTLPASKVRNDSPDPVQLGFSSIFWNTSWTSRQAPTTLGILSDPQHAALATFPTEAYSNWQWWYVIHQAGALRLDGLPRTLKPIVQIIDDWVTSRRLGLIIEAKVGRGKLIVVGAALSQSSDPVSRQLLASLQRYMATDAFKPAVELTVEQVQSLIAP
ncbi:MAG: sugar-binding domain-containing protein [Opitutus sp.]